MGKDGFGITEVAFRVMGVFCNGLEAPGSILRGT